MRAHNPRWCVFPVEQEGGQPGHRQGSLSQAGGGAGGGCPQVLLIAIIHIACMCDMLHGLIKSEI